MAEKKSLFTPFSEVEMKLYFIRNAPEGAIAHGCCEGNNFNHNIRQGSA